VLPNIAIKQRRFFKEFGRDDHELHRGLLAKFARGPCDKASSDLAP
jgi:hypothetical protein